MNLILFEQGEIHTPLPCSDPRMRHIVDVLGLGMYDTFSAGIIGDKRGKAYFRSQKEDKWQIRFIPVEESPPLHPLSILLGCPRPLTTRRLLMDLTCLGLREIRVCSTDLNEKSYLGSKLWLKGLWRNALIKGAMQNGTTLIPSVSRAWSLRDALKNLPTDKKIRKLALDNASYVPSYRQEDAKFNEAILAVGPERGWSNRERQDLRSYGFQLTRLGTRILRTETACSVGAALLLAELGLY